MILTQATDVKDGMRDLIGAERRDKSTTLFPKDVVQEFKRWECVHNVSWERERIGDRLMDVARLPDIR